MLPGVDWQPEPALPIFSFVVGVGCADRNTETQENRTMSRKRYYVINGLVFSNRTDALAAKA
jgi:hypothetical protein